MRGRSGDQRRLKRSCAFSRARSASPIAEIDAANRFKPAVAVEQHSEPTSASSAVGSRGFRWPASSLEPRHDVCLIESGAYAPDAETQSLYDLSNVGLSHQAELHGARQVSRRHVQPLGGQVHAAGS